MKNLVLIFLAFSMIPAGCGVRIWQNDLTASVKSLPSTLTADVASLPTLDLSAVESYEQFIAFIEAINALSKTLNEKSNSTFTIPVINDMSFETFQKTSSFITEYGPNKKL